MNSKRLEMWGMTDKDETNFVVMLLSERGHETDERSSCCNEQDIVDV